MTTNIEIDWDYFYDGVIPITELNELLLPHGVEIKLTNELDCKVAFEATSSSNISVCPICGFSDFKCDTIRTSIAMAR